MMAVAGNSSPIDFSGFSNFASVFPEKQNRTLVHCLLLLEERKETVEETIEAIT